MSRSRQPDPNQSQIDWDSGLRGMPIYGADGLQGTPENTKDRRKKKGVDTTEFSLWDRRCAENFGMKLADMKARREASVAWITEFKARVAKTLGGGA